MLAPFEGLQHCLWVLHPGLSHVTSIEVAAEMGFLGSGDSQSANVGSLFVLQSSKLLPHGREQEDSTKFIVLTFLSLACIVGVLLASSLIYCLRHSSHHKLKKKLSGLGGDTSADATAAYQVRKDCF